MASRGTLRVLIIDHYDSYTNNLLQLLQGTGIDESGNSYPEWSSAVVRFDQFTWKQFKESILPSIDAVVLSPGPGRPDKEQDFGFNSKLIQEISIPVLGVCLGHQGIGTSNGAKIIQAPNIKHGQISNILHTGSGVLRGLPQGFEGVRYNSLVLDEQSLPSDLDVTAWTYDAEDPSRRVLMGVQHKHRPIFGVQWHPESVCSSRGLQILNNFREIVLDFWASNTSFNHWTRRSFSHESRLPPSITERSAIVKEAQSLTYLSPLLTTSEKSRQYQVKIADLGRGIQPHIVFERFVHDKSLDGEAWLDSSKVRDVHSRNSYLAAASFSFRYSTKTNNLAFFRNGKQLRQEKLESGYWTWLNNFQENVVQKHITPLSPQALGQESEVGQPILQIGLIGYFGYELKRESLPGYSFVSPKSGTTETDHADTQLLFVNQVLWLDHYTRQWKLVGLVRSGETELTGKADPIAEFIGSDQPVGLTEAEFNDEVERIREAFAHPPSPPHGIPSPLPLFTAEDDEASYSAAIASAQESIGQGETYELTMTTKFKAFSDEKDPYAMYLSLRERNPAPYSAYMHFPTQDLAILSSSPERFVSIDRDGVAEMKPIKGTIAVSSDEEENQRRIDYLATDKKEIAENLMIVDLIRADMHNVAPSETITVPKLLHVESYETVHQLVTTIRAQIPPQVGRVKVLERCFPPGSMTGAPKTRSVQILDGLENHQDRGVYSGSLGYLCVSGCCDQSVVIRTIVKRGNELTLGAGGAITWLSQPDKEWEEVLTKANSVARALPRGEKGRVLEKLEDC